MKRIGHLLVFSLLLSFAFLIPVEVFFHSPWNESHLQVHIIFAVCIFLVLQVVSIYYLHKKLTLFPIRYWSCVLWFVFFFRNQFCPAIFFATADRTYGRFWRRVSIAWRHHTLYCVYFCTERSSSTVSILAITEVR